MASPTLKIEQIEPSDLDNLRKQIKGQVIAPADPEYNSARKAWNLSVDQHPALIVIAQSSEDIRDSVRYAKANALKVTVQATGHGVIRVADGSLLINTSKLIDVRVDAKAQIAWVSAGAKWAHVLAKTNEVGLAPLLGSTPDVGAVGYTLGGGMGWLARKFSLSADSVTRFEVVTVDGEIITASATQNSDLFWALRGGGGNFGIVTGMEIKLYPVTTLYGGNLFYPVESANEVFARFGEWTKNTPEELTSSVLLMNFPPIPDLPDFLRGKSFVMVRGAYCGPVEKGEALLDHWRKWQAPIIDDFKVMPFSQIATISNDPIDPLPSTSSGAWLKDVDESTAEILSRFVLPHMGPPMLAFAEIRHAGGAISRVDPASAAYGNRDAEYILQTVGVAPKPEAKAHIQHHISEMFGELAPQLHGGVYMNFLEGEEARNRTRQGFSPETFKRLQTIKAKFDPHNLFSHSYDLEK